MRRIALIPARGGSKRLPRKNLIDFLGKPIIAWTIEAARESGIFEKVVVSTEDEEIATVAKKHGVAIDERKNELASDSARISDVCLDYLSRNEGVDILCCLYATAPLRTASDIKSVVELIKPGICDFSIAATYFDLPPHQALKVQQDNFVTPQWPELVNMRSADIGLLAVDNGSTYAVNVAAFQKTRSFYGSNMRAHLMPRERSQDIDEAIDLELARFYAQKTKAPA
jgi:CMP-N-acetylneuraminic acid synthetase